MIQIIGIAVLSVPGLGMLYADPGSGILIWQLLAAAGFGLLFYTKVIIRKIRAFIGARGSDDKKV